MVKSKSNSIETLISQALNEIIMKSVLKNFKKIFNEKEKFEKMKESIRMMKSSDGLNENIKSIRKTNGNAQS